MVHDIRYGEEVQSFVMPSGWKVLPSKLPREGERRGVSVSELVRQALANPLGALRLEEVLAPGKRVAIVTDDGARPTPIREMIPVLLDELLRSRIKKADIDIVIALGTHSQMKSEALSEKLGKEVVNHYRVSQHDCMSNDLVPIGLLKTGAEVKINPIVAEADLRIGMGSVLPHPMNGFGGGPKIIFPGVSNYLAIREHHLAHTIHPNTIFGNTEGNRFYEEVFRLAEAANLDYSLNCIFDMHDQITTVLFGSCERVHERGSERSRQSCAMTFSEKSDVTLISAFPYEDPFQIIKPLIVGSLVTKPGGTVILLAKTRERMPLSFVSIFEEIQEASEGKIRDFVVGKFRSNQLLLEGAAVDFNCALFFALLCRSRYRLVVISNELGHENMERMGFAYYESLEEALKAESSLIPRANVNLIPVGGILPILPEKLSMDY